MPRRTARFDRHDITDQIDAPESRQPTEQNDPTASSEPKLPIDPIESAEPTEPMDSTEFLEATERNEPSEAIDQRDGNFRRCWIVARCVIGPNSARFEGYAKRITATWSVATRRFAAGRGSPGV